MSETIQPRVVTKVLETFSSSTGALKICDADDVRWVIKPLRTHNFENDQVLNYNEQVVGHIGHAFLPDIIPEVAIANISQEIIEGFCLSGVVSGLCHASRFVKGFGNGEAIRRPSESVTEVRFRIARLAALLRLCATEGRQFFYKELNNDDALVYSVDHGSSFLDGDISDGKEGQWLSRCLLDDTSLSICWEMTTTAGLTRDEAARGTCVLKKFTDDVITDAVNAPPESRFGISLARRENLAKWLQNRRNTLLASACQFPN